MKKLILFFVPLFVGITNSIAAPLQKGQNNKEDKEDRWCRPLKADYKTVYQGDSILFFKDEWFQTPAKSIGNLMYCDTSYNTDKLSILVYGQKDSLNTHTPFPLILSDSIELVDSGKKTNSIYLYRDGDSIAIRIQSDTARIHFVRLINEKKNKIVDSIQDYNHWKKYEISCLGAFIRFSPDGSLTTRCPVADIPGRIEVRSFIPDTITLNDKSLNVYRIKNKIVVRAKGLKNVKMHVNGTAYSISEAVPDSLWENWEVGVPVSFTADRMLRTKPISSTEIKQLKEPDRPVLLICVGLTGLLVGAFVVWLFGFCKKKKKALEYSVDKPENARVKADNPDWKPGETESKDIQEKIKSLEGKIDGLASQLEKLNVNDLLDKIIEVQDENYGKHFAADLEKIKESISSEYNRFSEKERTGLIDRDLEKIKCIMHSEYEEVFASESTHLKEELKEAKYEIKNEKQNSLEHISRLNKDLNDKNEELKTTTVNLTQANIDLKNARIEIEDLKKAQIAFDSQLVLVDYARNYAEKIQELLYLSKKIEKERIRLLVAAPGLGFDQLHFINKYLSKYNSAINEIDMQMFYTDVTMVAQGKFIFKTRALAAYEQDGNRNETMKQYFFTAYLQKFIDALMVFNESLIGLEKLVGISSVWLARFALYREQLLEDCHKLGITVKSVKIMENAGENVGLSVSKINFRNDIPRGSILEIENCLVYLTGGRQPDDKIRVTVQE